MNIKRLVLLTCISFVLVGCSNTKEGEQTSPEALNDHEYIPTPHEAVNNLEGVTMRVKEGTLSSTGLTVVFENKTDKEIIYGDPYTLEKNMDGKWFEVPDILDGNYGFNDIGYPLGPASTNEWEVDWEWLYGKLDKGQYRLVKYVLDFRKAGDYDQYYLAVEFEVQ